MINYRKHCMLKNKEKGHCTQKRLIEQSCRGFSREPAWLSREKADFQNIYVLK